jgi:AcrR family transcriptional regulator
VTRTAGEAREGTVDRARSRPGGRTARTRTAVLDATVAELVERGYGGLTIDSVATRAGTTRPTIYRRWGGLDGLLVDAVETFAAGQADVPDTGDVDEDLRLWARSILRTLTGAVSGALIRALFGGAGDSPLVAELRHRFWTTRVALVRPVVDRAVERGQLPGGTDVDEVIRHVGAPLYYRLLVLGQPLTPAAADLAAAVTAAAAHAGVFVPEPGAAGVEGQATVRDQAGPDGAARR